MGINSYIISILAIILTTTYVVSANDMQAEEMQTIVAQMKQEMQDAVQKMQREMDQKVDKMQKKMAAMEESISQERNSFNQNMNSMQAALATERELMRETAGGAPEALRSNGGNATVRVGGKIAVRYYADFDSNYNHQGQPQPSGGQYASKLGWTMDTASVTIDTQFNEDLSLFIDIRPSSFDKAYFQWNNIGGSGLGTQVGFIGIPAGMYSSSTDMWGRVFITNPVVKEFSQAFMVSKGSAANNPTDDIKRMGVKLYYQFFDQLTLTGTIFSPSDLGNPSDLLEGYSATDSRTILAPNGDPRNNGFMSQSISLEYKPAFLEGLLLSATYAGLADLGQGTFDSADRRGSSFCPKFDLGVAYLTDKYGVYFETAYNLNPGFYSDTYNLSMSLGADYSLTEKLSLAVGAAYGFMASSSDKYKATLEPTGNAPGYPHFESSTVRLRIGARYNFANGVWVKGEYGHLFSTASGMNDNSIKDGNHFTLETGVVF